MGERQQGPSPPPRCTSSLCPQPSLCCPRLIPLLPAVLLSFLPSFLHQSPAGGHRMLVAKRMSSLVAGAHWQPSTVQYRIERQHRASPLLSLALSAGAGTGYSI